MAKLISCSINLSKIDKTKFTVAKNGDTYLNFTVAVNDQEDKYGKDTALTLNQTEEERKSRIPKTYIGNGKTVWSSEGATKPPKQSYSQNNPIDDDLPF